MTSVQRLVHRLRQEGWPIPDKYTFRRLYPGHWQRAAGAWSWTIFAGSLDIGSPDNVARCLKSKTLHPADHGTIYAD